MHVMQEIESQGMDAASRESGDSNDREDGEDGEDRIGADSNGESDAVGAGERIEMQRETEEDVENVEGRGGNDGVEGGGNDTADSEIDGIVIGERASERDVVQRAENCADLGNGEGEGGNDGVQGTSNKCNLKRKEDETGSEKESVIRKRKKPQVSERVRQLSSLEKFQLDYQKEATTVCYFPFLRGICYDCIH